MILDANILLYAVDSASPHHRVSRDWLTDQLNGSQRVGFPWPSLTAFVRIVTHPRALAAPLDPSVAWGFVSDWLSCEVGWVPVPTDRHAAVLGDLITRYRVGGNLIPDAHLAALAIQYGVEIASADTDFARFTEVRWVNPLATPNRV